MSPEAEIPVKKEVRFMTDGMLLKMGRVLVEKGLVRRDQIDELNARRALTGESLDAMLIKEGMVSETEILEILSELSRIPFRSIADLAITADCVARVSPRIAIRYDVMPVAVRGDVVTLATRRPPQAADVDGLRMALNAALEWTLCTESDISQTLKHFYGLGAETIDHISSNRPRSAETEIEIEGKDISAETADEGVVKFVNQLIAEAIRMEATDIHIEPFEDRLRLRYRIDGILQPIPVPKDVTNLRKAISSCIKIMAEMDISERRKPHDGRIKVRSGQEEFDLRVSVLPTRFGETVNMRLLNRQTMFIDLAHLGLSKEQMVPVEYLGSMPHGVVLLTGPTGSGKTTTLYALLDKISSPDVKIITAEDPIEYQMSGISQIQVHAQIGLTFASILRSILRHDPDIILIGEIRDMETADIAVRSSLTGHLVFSTLHTNDAPSAVTRLVDMGVEPFLIASCLEGAIAQRLVRRVCSVCREAFAPADVIYEEIANLYPDRMADAVFYRGKGCPHCNFSGYRSRLGLFEIMVMNDVLRGMVSHQRPSTEIKYKAIESGMTTLRQDGWLKVLNGHTSIDEVVRVARKVDLGVAPGTV
jgi:type II secretory ATPase GspE/PulE/Tfp pilus assembly ATPase PilB-like protein